MIYGQKHSPKTKAKIRAKLLGVKKSDTARKNISAGLRKVNDQARERIKNSISLMDCSIGIFLTNDEYRQIVENTN